MQRDGPSVPTPPTGDPTRPPTGDPTRPPTGVTTRPPTSDPTRPPTGVGIAPSTRRGVSPVLGVVLLAALTVTLAGTVGIVVTATPTEPPPTATFSLSADAGTDSITIAHEGGDTLVPSTLGLVVTVDGTELTHQPPVPFFAARGFESGPTGPLNSRSDDRWRAGEESTIVLAGTNDPQLQPGQTVTVRITADRHVLGEVETTAG